MLNLQNLLIARGANIVLVDQSGMNALHHAVEYGAIAVIDLLLAQGPPDTETHKKLINARTLQGVTPLILAAEINFFQAFKMLLQSKADLNAKTDQGFTALHCAARKKHARKKQVKSRKELMYNTITNIQDASIMNIEANIKDSYLTLSRIEHSVKQKRRKLRKPLSSVSQWNTIDIIQ